MVRILVIREQKGLQLISIDKLSANETSATRQGRIQTNSKQHRTNKTKDRKRKPFILPANPSSHPLSQRLVKNLELIK
jgi:hypothetical protein